MDLQHCANHYKPIENGANLAKMIQSLAGRDLPYRAKHRRPIENEAKLVMLSIAGIEGPRRTKHCKLIEQVKQFSNDFTNFRPMPTKMQLCENHAKHCRPCAELRKALQTN